MAGRFTNPLPQFMDATPTMLSGAKLFFYASGTSTKQNTYSDSALTSPNTNPVILNSAGRPAVDIFLQDLNYKVVLAPSTDSDPPTSPIWTADNYNARDSKLIAKTVTGSGSPNGSVAGTAGSASILPDFYWDYTNDILYVCTTTGTTSTAVWTAVNASAAIPAVPPPQGRLTLVSAQPVIAADAASATAVYYTPYIGTLVPVYNGTTMIPSTFTELTLTLSSSHLLHTLYDVFVFSNSGVLTLVTGPAWSVSTDGSGSRGTGAATTELTRVNGLLVNKVSISARNGASTYTVGASLATYLGTILTDGTNGQVTCRRAWGSSRKWGVWNAYNRVPVYLKAGDSTSSWIPTGSVGPSNGGNSYTQIVVGLQEEICDANFKQNVSITSTTGSSIQVGIGFNSTSSMSGLVATLGAGISSGTLTVSSLPIVAQYTSLPAIGAHTFYTLEKLVSGTGTASGGEDDMILTVIYRE